MKQSLPKNLKTEHFVGNFQHLLENKEGVPCLNLEANTDTWDQTYHDLFTWINLKCLINTECDLRVFWAKVKAAAKIGSK